ncbi:MAG: hypothetical protein ABIN97_16615, partial [Ginsengibacter sp.]
AVYSVTVISGNDTLESEPVPVEVKITQPLSILLIAASPDFENKFLKNWLTKNEYKFAVRTSISKNKYDKQFVNILPVPIDRITASLLEKFDIIIADASELTALPASDISVIRNYIETKGAGLIVKTDTSGNSSAFYLKSFPLIEVRDSVQHIIKLSLGDTDHIMASLKIEQPIYIRNMAATQPLVKDQQMRTMVNSRMAGLGKIVLTTVGNTYTWQLAGNAKDYSSFWSYILQKAAKKIPLEDVWAVTPALPQKNKEVLLQTETVKANIPQAQTEDTIYMEQNYHLPYQWNAVYWPIKAGWQLIGNYGLTHWWYIYDDKNWNAVKAHDKITATKKYASNHPYKPSNEFIITTKRVEIQKIYFFIIFITCSGFLWFEKKFKYR